MIVLKGKYNTAKVFTHELEPITENQIIELLDQPLAADSVIRVMPDTHAGAGSTIGTTLTIKDRVVPHMVGVDIGCGMETTILEDTHIDFEHLDRMIHQHIPAGFAVRNKPHPMAEQTRINELRCKDHVDLRRARVSIGTLGGGNHFIEVNQDEEGTHYLVVHSGSRNIGLQVADYYQDLAVIDRKMDTPEGREIAERFGDNPKQLERRLKNVPLPQGHRSLSWLEGDSLEDYLHDMAIMQEFATINRKCMTYEILKHGNLTAKESFTTIHNYIDMEHMILRKGAISAQQGERVLIPINMRDGSILATGKGNKDWNYSAPHGAGRLMSRRQAKRELSLSEFKESMEGIYSSTVDASTLDEAPFAYKPMDEIVENMQDTVTINKILRPVYNFKASTQNRRR